MKKISIYFVDGRSLAYNLEENEYKRLVEWLMDNKINIPFRMVYNNIEHFIFKTAIEYILA